MVEEEGKGNPELEDALKRGGLGKEEKTTEYQPIYKVVGESKIPVSKHFGKIWEARRDQAYECRRSCEDAWREAIRYYDNDQTAHRTSGAGEVSGNRIYSRRLNNQFNETENLVFSNTTTMLPRLYARNPRAEFTATVYGNEDAARALEKLVNSIFSMKEAPGINIKPKARRAILSTLLTNTGIIKIDWIQKAASNEEAFAEIKKISEKLGDKNLNKKEIQKLEGQLQALEASIDLLSSPGPFCKVVSPFNLLIDPDAQEADGSDAQWMIETDFLPTEFLRARYMTETNKGHASIYEPTHIIKNKSESDGGVEDEVNNFTLLNDKSEHNQHGFDSVETYNRACRTKVHYVWDKTTRRVYMFHDKDWSWPIWVWNDPLQLPRFYPYFILHFHEAMTGSNPKGEITYYLDQQDAINSINDEMRRSRGWAKRNIFYNKNLISQDDVEKVLKGDDGTARGIDVPEGQKLTDVIFSLAPPALKFPELFDKSGLYQAINRISSVKEVMTGSQFKTNTTNGAISEYTEAADVRIDEKTDLIEDWIGEIAWNVALLCIAYMPAADVASVVGEDVGNVWQNMVPGEAVKMYRCTVIGGSGSKPTSGAKKREALEMGQILGQFVTASPAIVLLLLKIFEEAFDQFTVTAEDWQMVKTSIEQQLMGQTQQNATEDPTRIGSQEEQAKQQVAEMIKNLPPEKQQQLADLIESGMKPTEALQQITQS